MCVIILWSDTNETNTNDKQLKLISKSNTTNALQRGENRTQMIMYALTLTVTSTEVEISH